MQLLAQIVHILDTVFRYFPDGQAHIFAVFTTKLLTQVKQPPVISEHVGQRALQARQTPLFVAVMYYPVKHLQALFWVSAVKVALHEVQTPVLNEQVAQLEGQATQMLFPLLYLPAGQLIIFSHNLVVGLNHWMSGSGLQAQLLTPKV